MRFEFGIANNYSRYLKWLYGISCSLNAHVGINTIKLIDGDFVVSLHIFLGPRIIVSACVFKCAP